MSLITTSRTLSVAGLMAGLLFSAGVLAEELKIEVTLSGASQVPPLEVEGTGRGEIVVNKDRSIGGSVTTENVDGTMAHIHEAPADANGPVAVPLERTDDNTWSVPDGARLTEEQYKALKAGNLYINVHTEANPAGEIRGQLEP